MHESIQMYVYMEIGVIETLEVQAHLMQGVCIEASWMSQLNPTVEPQTRLRRKAQKHWDQQEDTNHNHFQVAMELEAIV